MSVPEAGIERTRRGDADGDGLGSAGGEVLVSRSPQQPQAEVDHGVHARLHGRGAGAADGQLAPGRDDRGARVGAAQVQRQDGPRRRERE